MTGTLRKKTYTYNGKDYQIVEESKIKIGGIWIPVIIYSCLYENEDGMTWVRTKEEFFRLFEHKKARK